MSDLISRSMAKAEIMDWARVITNPKMLSTEDTMHLLDSMEGATDEEFKAEAKRRGYNLIKIKPRNRIKLLPCVCGRKQINHFCMMEDHHFYICPNCSLMGETADTFEGSRLNWNAMIEEKMKDAEKENG